MTRIELETSIQAPISICFDLSRSVELHQISTASTRERAISGRLKGLFEKGDTITWHARHFGIFHKMTMKISEMKYPHFFEDIMLQGIFESIRHQHYFLQQDRLVLMKDIFEYRVPYGILGFLFNKLVLTRYMTNLLLKRNQTIKEFAEEGKWKTILPAAT
jgi:ligand-binding SRPBCC domain-containing protein